MSIHGISGLGRLAENVSEAEADGFVDVGEEIQENDDEVEAGAQFLVGKRSGTRQRKEGHRNSGAEGACLEHRWCWQR